MVDAQKIIESGAQFLKGNGEQLKLSLTALLAGKHVLIEDGPGKGKTLLVKYIGKLFQLDFRRIQFTNDLMPSDIIGFNYYDRTNGQFIFKEGPLFAEILLTDEINRGSSRTQSALLQAMEERQVSVEDKTFELSPLFCVFATQNPREQVGTAALPESQLDRFLLKFKMTDLSSSDELDLLNMGSQHEDIKKFQSTYTKETLKELKEETLKVQIPQSIKEWIVDFLQASRQDPEVTPLSSRAGLDFILAIQAYAFLSNRKQVLPEDVVTLFPYCFGHRLYQNRGYTLQLEQTQATQWLKKLKK